jgi:hypothetical protein
MAQTTPRVKGTALAGGADGAGAILVGTPAWFAWLQGATTFAFASDSGTFTARQERGGRAGWYWKAYRRQDGKLRTAYLGKSQNLTIDRLNAVAAALTQREPTPMAHAPAQTDAVAVSAGTTTAVGLPPTGTITFLFTDIEGGSSLWERDAVTMRQALARHDVLVAAAVARHAGTLVRARNAGDSHCAVFARASDAIAAAYALQQALCVEHWPTPTPLCVRLALFDCTQEAGSRGVEPEKSTLAHFAFTIPLTDFDGEKKRLEQLGLNVETAEHAWVHWRSLYVRDPEGNLVELVCYDEGV